MEELMENDLFHLVFGILAAIFFLGALVNAIRTRIRNNRRETASIIKNNGNTGDEHSPVRLENPFAGGANPPGVPQRLGGTPRPTETPVPASAAVAAAGNPTDQSVKAPAGEDEEYVWR